MKRGKLVTLGMGLGLWSAMFMAAAPAAHAITTLPAQSNTAASTQPAPGDFDLQITPSPLVTTVKPGVKTQVELKIRNGGSGTEALKIEPKAFTYNSSTGQVNLGDANDTAVSSWTSFSAPKFTVQAGQWFSEQITFNTPKDAGFSYSFALEISRQSNPAPQGGTRLIKGSVAVFSLVNVDRPGATSSLKVVQFTSSKKLYEYLPATLNVRFKNTGNTIVQPYGNIFVQRGTNAKKPLASLAVNDSKGYILPGTERTVSASWNDGFATYQSTLNNGTTTKHLNIDWAKLSHFRIGRYTAHLVAVYNDGQHDIPIEGTVSFWVIPWRAILGFIIIVVLLWLLARWNGKRRTAKAVKRALAAQAAAVEQANKQKTAARTEEKA
jgi:hypothetical protein